MDIDDRFDAVRQHGRRRHHMDFAEFERDLDELQAAVHHEARQEAVRFAQLQAELAELLRRVPPPPDTTPARVVVTVC